MRSLESFKKNHSKSEGLQLIEKIFATYYTHTVELRKVLWKKKDNFLHRHVFLAFMEKKTFYKWKREYKCKVCGGRALYLVPGLNAQSPIFFFIFQIS